MQPAIQNKAQGERETISKLSLPDALALALQMGYAMLQTFDRIDHVGWVERSATHQNTSLP
ncbi:MAG: hypothetical protein ABIN99_06330 [Nitrosospira sp.]